MAKRLVVCLLATVVLRGTCTAEPIDRRRLVERHAVVHRSAAKEHFLQVGNGEFAFAFDVTGMQTLDREFPQPIPLHTMSNWAWHTLPNVEQYEYVQTLSEYQADGRTVTYADRQTSPAGEYFRANPHRVNLARIGLVLDGEATPAVEDFSDIEQRLDLWTGCAASRFKYRGEPVEVLTVAHPQRDAVAFRIESPLVADGKLQVQVRFSYPLGVWGPAVDDFDKPQAHTTVWRSQPDGGVLERGLDGWKYSVAVHSTGESHDVGDDEHSRRFGWPGRETGETVVEFSQGEPAGDRLTFSQVRQAAAAHWAEFWSSGGAIELAGSSDPRAAELERRIVLSQYLTAIQNGSLPPQETGLLCNSWFGKPHLEMHWWHAAHFAVWGRPEVLERSLGWYGKIQPAARAIAERQGYRGVRWPKMTGPEGVSSPSGVGEFLVWQQPHMIYLAELAYRAAPAGGALERYCALVDETAEFMADFVAWDDAGRCHLAPPLIPAQENYDRRTTRDPAFEVAYWHWALGVAQQWRERRGEERVAEWDRVRRGLGPLVVKDGRYAAVAVEPFTKTADHPSMLAAIGVLPASPLVDRETMLRTARWVDGVWEWESTWGWDFPMRAMTYARCGDPERAIDALLHDTPKNRYLPNGHNYQAERLPAYLPGNGGLLAAAALMAAGWDGSDDQAAPGFPMEGWQVRYDGLRPWP